MDLVAKLFSDFNVYRAQTKRFHDMVDQGYRVSYLKPTAARLALIDEMVTWCRDRNLEPRLWLFTLFKQRQWVWPPKFERGHLLSEKHIPKYKRATGLGFFRKRLEAGDRSSAFDPNRDTAASVEALKWRYATSAQQQRCLDEVMVKTLGYHPQSDICRKCSVRGPCAVKLQSHMPFDIIALRKGSLTQEEAEAIACGR